MVKRTVVWTQTAVKQRREILKYWTLRNRSARYSEKLIKLISKRLQVILKNPEAFNLTDFPETRISALGHFSILYKITPGKLIVTAFWDNRQNPDKLLKIISS